MTMAQLTPYLSFNGNCAEAMRFYERVFNGKLETLLTNGESPVAEHCPPGNEDRIMHAYLTFEGTALMAGDAYSNEAYEPMKGFSVALNYETAEKAQRVFDDLSEGAKVTMPFSPAFWAEGFGMLTDRYGTPWIINGGMKPV
jgi:PhnB protein